MTSKQVVPTPWISWFLVFALGFALAACSSPEERAQAHYESGKALLIEKEYVKAGLEFRNALKYNEKLSGAWYDLATVEQQVGNWPLVIDALARVVELDPSNFDARIRLAKLQFAAIKLDQALKSVNEANELRSNDTDVLALRAAILFRLADREGARANAERALSLNPDNVDAHAVLAADQIADGNYKGALLFANRGLEKDPSNLGLLMFKLKVLEDTRDYANFELVLRQIIAAHPDVKPMRQALLSFLASRNRFADVETEMRAMVKADPDDTVAALDFVRLVGSQKGAAEARKEIERLIALKPNVVSYKLALAQLDFSEKRTDIATAAVAAIIAKGEPKDDVQRARLLLAGMKIELGLVDEAKTLVNDALAGDAKNAEALALRANFSLEEGKVDIAVADLREALNQKPNAVPILVLLARAHERQGVTDLATSRFTEAVKASDYNPRITLDYIAFLKRRGKTEEIENTLNEAVTRNPGDPGLLTALAELRLNNQDWVGAQKVADALKKIGDKSAVSSQITAALLFGQKKYDEGIEVLKVADAAAPQTERIMDLLILTYLQAGKVNEAENFIQSILTANENNAAALVHLGSIKMLQQKPKEAEAAFRLAIERQPENAVGYGALSRFYFSQEKPAEGEAMLRQGHNKVPRDLSINLRLASILELKNDIEGAIAIYEQQLKTEPDALIVINNLASLLADYRSDAASLERAQQLSRRLEAIEIPQFKDTVGWVAYRKGDYRTAVLNLEAAVEKLPNNALAKYHLAMTYVALKRNADAEEQFAEARALLKDGNPLKKKISAAADSVGAAK